MNDATADPTDRPARRAAVIFNPTKISDGLRDLIEDGCRAAGWAEPVWLETSEDDPGRRMAEQARADGADLVMAAGGDGTVRAVAATLADSGIPLAIIPQGTGNLLARNLGIPLQDKAAVDVALHGADNRFDIVGITTDAATDPDRFAVMAGIGLDAAIMSNTDDGLKDKIGSLAYVVAAARELGRRPRTMTVTVDDGKPLRRKAMICLVGNVGAIQGDVQLIPDARPDDGRLDVVIVASPSRLRHWLAVLAHLITRRPENEGIDRLTGRRVVIELDEPDDYELDGDTIGRCRRLVAEIEPGALTVRVPSPPEE